MHQTEVDGSTLQSLQAENKRLRRAVEELSILNELARDIGASASADEVMQKIISRSLRVDVNGHTVGRLQMDDITQVITKGDKS